MSKALHVVVLWCLHDNPRKWEPDLLLVLDEARRVSHPKQVNSNMPYAMFSYVLPPEIGIRDEEKGGELV
jgi:hypothetical protein